VLLANVSSVPHTEAFQAVRDALLDLDEAERRRLTTLLGCMTDPQPPLAPGLVRALAAIGQLSAIDRELLARWCGSYLSAFGQIPRTAGRLIKPR